MSVTPTITFTNALPSATSLVTFTLTGTDGNPPLVFTASAGASVAANLDGLPQPWTVTANVSDINAIDPAYDIGPSAIDGSTTTVNVVPNIVGVLDIRGPGAGRQTPAAPSGRSAGGSIFDLDPAQADMQLNFTMQLQSQTQWCWCTVAACVGNYYGADNPWTQCKLATWKFPACGDCCGAPLPGGCNNPASVMEALTHVGHLNAGTMGALSLEQVKVQLDARRPIGVNVQWNGSTLLHSVVITGYDAAGKITVQDPANASTTVIAYADFPARYLGGASWYATFTTKS